LGRILHLFSLGKLGVGSKGSRPPLSGKKRKV
jgi:hypothetical protein